MARPSQIVPFLDSLESASPATLSDHILTLLKPTILGDYRSLTAGCTRRLKAGGSHHHLLGKTVFGSVTSGPAPKWVGNVPLRADAVAKPDWMSSVEVVTVMQNMRNLAMLDDETKAALARVAKSSKATMKAGFELFRQLSEKASEEAILKTAAESERDMMMSNMAKMVQDAVDNAMARRAVTA